MNNTLLHVQASMQQTAQDFQNIVWPIVRTHETVAGGTLIPVEGSDRRDMLSELDYIAGVDAWHISSGERQLRGLASRVQRCYVPYQSFSIRYRLSSGNRTEYDKRLEAIHSVLDGGPNWLFPDLTVQAFIHADNNSLLSCALIPTAALFLEAERLVDSKAIFNSSNQDCYGLKCAPDGNEFLYINWSYLIGMVGFDHWLSDSLAIKS